MCLVGAILTTAAVNPDMIFAGRFFIGVAVGSLSTAVPMYNSEISPAEVRGTMVGTWQLSVTLGIMISYWVGFGTNYISDTNSVAWRLPVSCRDSCGATAPADVQLAVQAIPAIGLAVGTLFIPYSPRWLVSHGRDEEALRVLARVRNRSIDDEVVRLEFLEIKADALFEKQLAVERFPKYAERPLALQLAQVKLLFSTWPMFRRTAITCLMMVSFAFPPPPTAATSARDHRPPSNPSASTPSLRPIRFSNALSSSSRCQVLMPLFFTPQLSLKDCKFA